MSDVLILDGWQHRRAPVHWQGWLAERLTEHGWGVQYLTLPDPEHPRFADWSATVDRALRATEEPPVVVAHGLSVLLWLRMCEESPQRERVVPRALLVAPPAPGAHGGDVSEYRPSPTAAAAIARSHARMPLLVSADDDPYLPEGAAALVDAVGVEWVRLAEGAHLNTASGYGPWPEALAWCLSGAWPATDANADPQEDDMPDAADTLDLDGWLAERFRPEGHRLGILTAEAPEEAVEAVDRVIAASGLSPRRRHARLTPRAGEAGLRAADVADFIERYGHEYQAAVIDASLMLGDDAPLVRAALANEAVHARFI